eukprot:45761-Amphidinium_carterae.1
MTAHVGRTISPLNVSNTLPTDGSAAVLAPLAAHIASANHAPISFTHLHRNSPSPMAFHSHMQRTHMFTGNRFTHTSYFAPSAITKQKPCSQSNAP